MFLSDITITNIQNRVNTQVLRNEVKVVAIHQHRGQIIARLKFDDEDIGCVLESKEGQNLADAIADVIRFNAYYRMADIYSGLECDDEAESILALWPLDQGATVQQLRPTEVISAQTFTKDIPGARIATPRQQADKPVVPSADITALNQKFGGRR